MCGGMVATRTSMARFVGRLGESGAPRIAAEDVARAMVADMAAELGGSVTWPTVGVMGLFESMMLSGLLFGVVGVFVWKTAPQGSEVAERGMAACVAGFSVVVLTAAFSGPTVTPTPTGRADNARATIAAATQAVAVADLERRAKVAATAAAGGE
jgi:hypothetical protein